MTRYDGWNWPTLMFEREAAKSEKVQLSTWREYHSHCGHERTDDAAVLCDITEAYVTYCEEIRAKGQRAAWRASEPAVRNDGTRLVRDHHLALEMNRAADLNR